MRSATWARRIVAGLVLAAGVLSTHRAYGFQGGFGGGSSGFVGGGPSGIVGDMRGIVDDSLRRGLVQDPGEPLCGPGRQRPDRMPCPSELPELLGQEQRATVYPEPIIEDGIAYYWDGAITNRTEREVPLKGSGERLILGPKASVDSTGKLRAGYVIRGVGVKYTADGRVENLTEREVTLESEQGPVRLGPKTVVDRDGTLLTGYLIVKGKKTMAGAGGQRAAPALDPSLAGLLKDLEAVQQSYQIQTQLARAGFDPGPRDGRLGPLTQAALRRFQVAQGLPATGLPDDATRTALAAPPQAQGTGDPRPLGAAKPPDTTRRQAEAPPAREGPPGRPAVAVQNLRFFETGQAVPTVSQRQYAVQFPQRTTRFVRFEVEMRNLRRGDKAHQPQVLARYYAPDGRVLGQAEGTAVLQPAWETVQYSHGLGWATAGYWGRGTYRVELVLDGQAVAHGRFTID